MVTFCTILLRLLWAQLVSNVHNITLQLLHCPFSEKDNQREPEFDAVFMLSASDGTGVEALKVGISFIYVHSLTTPPLLADLN